MGKKIKLSALIACCVLLCSCAKPFKKDTFVISGTYLEVISPYERAAKIVYAEFDRLNKIFNLYDPDSELSRLNLTYNTPFKASVELVEILRLSNQLNILTNGAFDVSHGALYSFWKGLIKKGDIKDFPKADEIAKLKQAGGMQNIEVNPRDNTVIIKRQGLKIDLNAVAKGYMVDKAVARLKKEGIDSALINAGGDIYCLGGPPLRGGSLWKNNVNSYWKVGIKDPQELSGVIQNQAMLDEAIATSGNYEQFFEFKGEKHSHLIDPRTGYPANNNVLSVSVITKNCTSADGLASGFFIMGVKGIQDFLSKTPSTMRIFMVSLDEKGEKAIQIFQ